MIDLISEPDMMWIKSAVDVVVRSSGRPWRMALDHLDDLQRASQPTSLRRFSAVVGALQRVTGGRVRNARAARRARGLVLGHPVFSASDRQARIDHAALMLGTSPAAVEKMLWSDLPRERPIELPSGRPSEIEVAAFANVALLQRALRRAQSVELIIRKDDPGLIVRAAAARGLLITTRAGEGSETHLEIAGPLSLFHGSGVYGRALGDLVPLLAELRDWSMEIRVELPLASYSTHVHSPVLLPDPPARLIALPYPVARVARGLKRRERSLLVTPAPPPLRVGATLLWPDLVVEDSGRTTYIELVSFATREYLERKLAAYRNSGVRVLVCVDKVRIGSREDLPTEHVLRFSKTLPIDTLLDRLRAQT